MVMRKCPTAHQMLGYDSIWELSSSQFRWILEHLSVEFEPPKDKGVKKIN